MPRRIAQQQHRVVAPAEVLREEVLPDAFAEFSVAGHPVGEAEEFVAATRTAAAPAAGAGLLECAIGVREHLVPRLGDSRLMRDALRKFRDVRVGVGEVGVGPAALQWIGRGVGGAECRRGRSEREEQ